MTGINTYTVKMGFYNEVKDVEIYVPSSAVFIKDNKNCGDGLHEGHYHFRDGDEFIVKGVET